MRQTTQAWLILTPLAFLLKDVIATFALLSTEPGITAKAAAYYALALLPGSLFVESAAVATMVNMLVGAMAGLTVFVSLRLIRRRAS